MNFKFSDEELDIIAMARDFCEKEVGPIAAEIDEEERFPVETWHKLANMGMMGLPYDEEYNGAGMSFLTYIGVVEEISKYCASTATMVMSHTSLCAWPISQYGNDVQKEKYLKKLTTGEWLGAFALTEPGAGSDSAMQKTKAEDIGGHWLLNGSKIFITNADYANVYVVAAMTGKEQGTRGISAFIIEKDFSGFKIGTHEKKMGIRGSSTCELIFEDCVVPKENLLGELNKGFKVVLSTIDGCRIGIGAQAVGIAQAAIDECIKYTNERVQFGKTISQFQNTQFQLADMKSKVNAARLLVHYAAQAKQDGEPFNHLAAQAKLVASEAASDITRRCLQLIGGYGYTREYPFERYVRDAKITEIYDGTSEVLRMVIASSMGLK